MSEYDVATQEGHEQFVKTNWEALAVYAYAGYLQFGRGMLAIRPQDVKPGYEPGYYPMAALDHQAKQHAKLYNPEKEFLCGFILPGRGIIIARVFTAKDPSQTPAILHSVFKRGGKTQ